MEKKLVDYIRKKGGRKGKIKIKIKYNNEE